MRLLVLFVMVSLLPINWTKVQNLDPNAAPTNTSIRQKWALVIGIGKYKEERLNSSLRPDESAEKFKEYLLDPQAGRFTPNHVKSLINDAATYQNIKSALGASWIGGVAEPEDLVVVYLATTGFPTTDGGAYLTTYNSELGNVRSTCLSTKSLIDAVKQNCKANRIVFIVQSPYSGAAELDGGAKNTGKTQTKDAKELQFGKGDVLISSNENAFTDKLVSSLRKKNGLVGLPEAFTEARDKTSIMETAWKGQDISLGVESRENSDKLPEQIEKQLGAESHYLRANQLVEQGNFEDAFTEYEKATQIDPHYADAICDYGSALAMKGNWSASADKFKLAIAEKEEDPLFHANYARALFQLGKLEESLSELERAYALDPKDETIVSALANVYRKTGRSDKAVELLDNKK